MIRSFRLLWIPRSLLMSVARLWNLIPNVVLCTANDFGVMLETSIGVYCEQAWCVLLLSILHGRHALLV